jgi:transposase
MEDKGLFFEKARIASKTKYLEHKINSIWLEKYYRLSSSREVFEKDPEVLYLKQKKLNKEYHLEKIDQRIVSIKREIQETEQRLSELTGLLGNPSDEKLVLFTFEK